ncbi:hypothetical protein FACS1894218_1680 [Bacilli bacterium]|nr:hypothetical protein FACS1894218_1680 [Bacilli bacterium]
MRKFENAVEIFLNNEGNNGNTTFTGAVSQFIDILKTRQFKLKQMYQSQVLAEQSRIKLEQWHSQQTRFIK